jgi:hypothetical protein
MHLYCQQQQQQQRRRHRQQQGQRRLRRSGSNSNSSSNAESPTTRILRRNATLCPTSSAPGAGSAVSRCFVKTSCTAVDYHAFCRLKSDGTAFAASISSDLRADLTCLAALSLHLHHLQRPASSACSPACVFIRPNSPSPASTDDCSGSSTRGIGQRADLRRLTLIRVEGEAILRCRLDMTT